MNEPHSNSLHSADEQGQQPEQPEMGAAEMSLTGHLTELRSRLLRILLSIFIIFIGLFYFANDIYTFVSEPLRALLPEGTNMIATEVASPFLAPFKLTLVVSFFLSVPVILHQVWGFISPGLYQHEKKLAIPVLASSILLFYTGIAFAYYAVFPLIFGFFTSVGPEGVNIMTDINSYLNFVLKLFFAFGVAFEIPVATFLLAVSGVVSADKLAEKRPYIVLGCFVFGMLLTPPDVISQTLLALPMWLLFEVGVLLARMARR